MDDVSDSRLSDALAGGLRINSPSDDGLADVDAIFICVSTPVTAENEPDLRPVMAAVEQHRPLASAGAARRAAVDDLAGYDGGAGARRSREVGPRRRT